LILVVARAMDQAEAVAEWAAFVDAYRALMPAVYRYLFRGTGGDVALAEDLTQATFMAAVSAYRRGAPESLSSRWLQVVARSRLIDHYRRLAREESKLALIGGRRNDGGEGADDAAEFLSAPAAQAALGELPASQRAALVLRYLDDLPVGEVAEWLGRSVRATESLLARARRSFRAAYEERCDA
jgi:RNA polymerase sigma-70 factor, ECF subfamily